MINRIIKGFTENIILKSDSENPLWNSENKIFSKKNRWNYIDACMIKAVCGLYGISGEKKLFEFSEKYVSDFISENCTIESMDISAYNLDNINGAKNLLYFYQKTGNRKYLDTAVWIYENQILNQPRLKCGNFWHKKIYPFQIWLDGIYMSIPFLAEYSVLMNKPEIIGDITGQLQNVRDIMRDKNTGLYYHGYDESRSMYWADKKTGLSSEYWLRSICWLMAGLADIFEFSDGALKNICGNMLSDLISAMMKYQNDDGMFYQLPAKKNLSGNYPETSGTSLYAYSAMKSVRLGICGNSVKESGLKAFESLTRNYIYFENDIPVLKNICLVAGLGGENHRNGSAEYYLGEPVIQNDAKGIAPFIMAYTEYVNLTGRI